MLNMIKTILPALLTLAMCPVQAEPTFAADPVAVSFVKHMIREDYLRYLQGDKSLLPYRARVPALRVVAPVLVADYRNDAAVADSKYKGHLVRFVAAIRSSALQPDGTLVVRFVGSQDDFDDPIAYFRRSAAFHIDSTDSYLCVIRGKEGPTVRLDDCVSYDEEVDFDGHYMIPSYVSGQLNRWFAGGIVPAFIEKDRSRLERALFMIYWVGTQIKSNGVCISGLNGTNDYCKTVFAREIEAARTGDQAFVHAYRAAQPFLHLPPAPFP